MLLAMIQDDIVDPEKLSPAYIDRGTFFGDGVYEVLRSYNGKIFALDDHLARFKRSMAEIELAGLDIETVRKRVLKAFDTAKISNAKIYFHLTRGSAERNHNWPADLKPNFFLTVSTINENDDRKTAGVSVCTYPDLRWKRCDIKSLNLLPNVMAHQHADKKGCFDAILYNDDGFITEGSSSAFFQIFDKKLTTTPLAKNILPSISRKYVFMAAKNAGVEIAERQITPEQAKKADELFVAVTTRDILPVVSFDGVSIGKGVPGEITKQLIEEFSKFTR
jgi:D-alanine transaminase